MGKTLAQKIIAEHLVSGQMNVGEDIGLRIDQTLTQEMCIRDRFYCANSKAIPALE